MQSATVFNIQKFSLNDGPGIRTVVFLKGCPLRCLWCANPEGQVRTPQVEWKESACLACGHCLDLCPQAGGVERGGKRHVDVRRLAGDSSEAAQAVAECPGRALTFSGQEKTSQEVLEVCLQDKPFYEDSGGGVTLSGGEALTWPDFDMELLRLLHAEGVDSCVETEACVPASDFQAVAAHLDHLLVDLKHWDESRHRSGTGVGMELILENLHWAVRAQKDVLVRTPVIPGFNDGVEDARRMAQLIRSVGLERVQLLPFHNFGQSKYDLLDMDYQLRGRKNLHEEDLADFAAAYAQEGVEAFF